MAQTSDELSGKVAVSADGFEVAGKAKGVSAWFSGISQWLFPGWSARAKITAAISDRVADKIRSGEPLNDDERCLAALAYEQEAQVLLRKAALVERVEIVMPEVARLVGQSEGPIGETSEDFKYRASAIAGEIHADEIRDLFARVCAGEFCRPGSFSLKTLEVVRTLDPNVAAAFKRYRALLANGKFLICPAALWPAAQAAELTNEDISELRDAGLIDDDVHLAILSDPAQPDQLVIFGDRMLRIHRRHDRNVPADFGLRMANSHLTRAGRELNSVLQSTTNVEFFMALGWHLTLQAIKFASIAWTMKDSEDWQPFGRNPPAVVQIIPYDKEKWLLARDPREFHTNAITGDPTNPGRSRVVYAAYWAGSGWTDDRHNAQHFHSRAQAEEFLEKSHETIEHYP